MRAKTVGLKLNPYPPLIGLQYAYALEAMAMEERPRTFPCLSRVDDAKLWLAHGGWRGVHHPGDLPMVRALWHEHPEKR